MHNDELRTVLRRADRQRIRGEWAAAAATLQAAQKQTAGQTDEVQAQLWLALLGSSQTNGHTSSQDASWKANFVVELS